MHDEIAAWLRAAAVRVHEEAPALTALDQAIGDGDHGINMDRGFKAIVAMLDSRPAAADGTTDQTATADLLRQVGKTLISTVGGAAGPLYGTAFLRGAAAVAAEGSSAPVALAAALDAALDSGGNVAAVAAAAHSAAETGAAATIPMLATKGRASYLGERSIGHQDPGATSAALLLGVLAATAAANTAG